MEYFLYSVFNAEFKYFYRIELSFFGFENIHNSITTSVGEKPVWLGKKGKKKLWPVILAIISPAIIPVQAKLSLPKVVLAKKWKKFAQPNFGH